MFVRLLKYGYRFKDTLANENTKNIPNDVLISSYFNRLEDRDIEDLVNLYKLDFLLFNYSFSFRNKTYIWQKQSKKYYNKNGFECIFLS